MQTQKTNCNSSPLQKGDYRGIISRNYKGFTLVELIVVITILAILGTIAFISFSGYSQDARNSSRTSDVKTIEKSLQIYSTRNDTYPLPENPQEVTYDDGTNGEDVIYYQGTFGSSPYKEVGNLSNIPVDPLTKTQYIYSTTVNKNQYEILAIYEGQVVNNSILNQTHAAETYKPKVTGTYNKIFVKTASYYVPIPSLINSEVTNTGITLNNTNIKSQIITNGNNLPQIGTTIIQVTGAIQNLNLSVYTGGTISSTSTDTQKENLAKKIQEAYTGSDLATTQIYANILNKSSQAELVALVNSVVLGNGANNTLAQTTNSCNTTLPSCNGTSCSLTYNPTSENQSWIKDATSCGFTCTGGYTGANCETAPLTGWMAQDTSCDKPDVIIGTQTWAGCNSTLGNGFEFGQTNADIGLGTYNGTVGSCYDYSGNNTATCTKNSTAMASNTKANTWFTGTNTNGDSEVDNIWGKLYTWNSTAMGETDISGNIIQTDDDSICPAGRHIPSDAEWEYAEEYLYDQQNSGTAPNNCRNTTDGWLCDGTGWKLHSTTNATNNLVVKLGLPLAGYRYTDGSTFYGRGNRTYLWSSTPSSTTAYYRHLYWNNSTVNRYTYSQTHGFSVRCIKD